MHIVYIFFFFGFLFGGGGGSQWLARCSAQEPVASPSAVAFFEVIQKVIHDGFPDDSGVVFPILLVGLLSLDQNASEKEKEAICLSDDITTANMNARGNTLLYDGYYN